MKKTSAVSTVNVIELDGDEMLGVSSFKNNKKGNIEAEQLYHDLIVEDDLNILERDIKNTSCYKSVKRSYTVHLSISTNV